MIIPLGHTLPYASSDRTRRHRASNSFPTFSHLREWERLSIWSCSRWGLPSSQCHHRDWCALTAPFHPYRGRARSGMPFSVGPRRFVFCGTFLRVAPTGCYPAPCSMEPGLSSPCCVAKSDHLISFALLSTAAERSASTRVLLCRSPEQRQATRMAKATCADSGDTR